METGEPDETGEVGEEAAGPLSLPRPEGKPEGKGEGCSKYLGPFVAAVVSGFASGKAQAAWGTQIFLGTGWPKEDVKFAIQLIVGLLVFSFGAMATHIVHLKKPPAPLLRLVLERRGFQNQVEDKRFAVWSADSFGARAIRPLFLCLVGAGLLWFALSSSSLFSKILFSGFAALCLLPSIVGAEDVSKPLLILDAHGVHVGLRVLP